MRQGQTRILQLTKIKSHVTYVLLFTYKRRTFTYGRNTCAVRPFCAVEITNAGEIIADVAPPAMELFDTGEIATGIWAAEDLGAGDTIPDAAVDLGVGFFLHCPFAV